MVSAGMGQAGPRGSGNTNGERPEVEGGVQALLLGTRDKAVTDDFQLWSLARIP